MEALVVMNYVTGDVDIYTNVSPDANIDEDYIASKLGLRPSDCHWMFCQNGANVTYHEEELL